MGVAHNMNYVLSLDGVQQTILEEGIKFVAGQGLSAAIRCAVATWQAHHLVIGCGLS